MPVPTSSFIADAELTRRKAEYATRLLMNEMVNKRKGLGYLDYGTIALGLLTTGCAAVQAAYSIPVWTTIVTSIATSVAAVIDKRIAAKRDQDIPQLEALATESANIGSNTAQMIASWTINNDDNSWDEKGAQKEYFDIKRSLDQLLVKASKVGVLTEQVPDEDSSGHPSATTPGYGFAPSRSGTGLDIPRSGDGFATEVERNGAATKWRTPEGTEFWVGNPEPGQTRMPGKETDFWTNKLPGTNSPVGGNRPVGGGNTPVGGGNKLP